MRHRFFVFTLAVLAALALAPAARAQPSELVYEIRKEGEPIGRETVRIERQGERARVEVVTSTRVKVLFLDFRYDHKRSEEWQGGRLVRMVSETDDDGAKHRVEAAAEGDAWTLTVNGESRTLSADHMPLSLWDRAVVGKRKLFGVTDAKPYAVEVAEQGAERVTIAGRELPAERFRMSGGIERDLWYGPDGLLLRTTFERKGYPIEMVRISP